MTQQGHGNTSFFTNLGCNKDTFTKICIFEKYVLFSDSKEIINQ